MSDEKPSEGNFADMARMYAMPSVHDDVLEQIRELQEKYQTILAGLVQLLQEIPADLLVQADNIEQEPPADWDAETVAGYANGVRYAAHIVAVSVAAHIEADQAKARGEL